MTFTKQEVTEATLEYFGGDEMATEATVTKYLVEKDGEYYESTPTDMHRRMATAFADMERTLTPLDIDKSNMSDYGKTREFLNYDRILGYFDKFKYINPQGSVMALLGHPFKTGSLSNCIVLDEMHDSYGGINYADGALQSLMKRRCGVGTDLSPLRPEGAEVNNAAGTSTGLVSFMPRFSNTTQEVAQNGRRGALMLSLHVNHPSVDQFVVSKLHEGVLEGANISVQLSDEFMRAVDKNKTFTHRWPIKGKPEVTRDAQAVDVWDNIISAAHSSAEPGLMFWDRHHEYSTSSVYSGWENVSTNPCGEIAMNNDSCRLIAVNMLSCVINPYTEDSYFDYEKWYEIVYEAQRLGDDLVELELRAVEKIIAKIESDPEPDHIKANELRVWRELHRTGSEGRRTGTGYTAHGDTLAALGANYSTKSSLRLTERIMKTKCEAEFDSSIDLAIERGCFKDFDPDIEDTSKFVKMLKAKLPHVYDRMICFGRRNISISTVAPTGTLSLLTQTTSGIEPVFKLSYKRRRKISSDATNFDFQDDSGTKWLEFAITHKGYHDWCEINEMEPEINDKGISTDSLCPYFESTADEIDWIHRVDLQAVVQKYTTHSISSTINLPKDVSKEVVADIYMRAWKKGLKGITVYREGSRKGVLVSNDTTNKNGGITNSFGDNHAPKRPKTLPANVYTFQNHKEKWVGVIGLLDGRPYELFTGKADALSLIGNVTHGSIVKRKSGAYDFVYKDGHDHEHVVEGLATCFNPEYYNYGKLVSGVLRHGMPIEFVVEMVNNIKLNQDSLNTWTSGVGRILKKFIQDGTKASDSKCTECGDPDGVRYQEGCLVCVSCSTSKCG